MQQPVDSLVGFRDHPERPRGCALGPLGGVAGDCQAEGGEGEGLLSTAGGAEVLKASLQKLDLDEKQLKGLPDTLAKKKGKRTAKERTDPPTQLPVAKQEVLGHCAGCPEGSSRRAQRGRQAARSFQSEVKGCIPRAGCRSLGVRSGFRSGSALHARRR